MTGEFIDTASMDATYWYTNLRSRVGFEPAVRALVEGGAGCFLEMSPTWSWAWRSRRPSPLSAGSVWSAPCAANRAA
ncbi:hypothetical protein NKH77_44065 [Streptomyces sp. M19]